MKLTKRISLLVAALAAAALVVVPVSAPASQPKAQAQVLGPIVDNGDGTATVTARYICPDGFHLWISAKQSADGRPDQRLREEGSSQHSKAWYSAHPAEFDCDGRWHTQSFVISSDYQGSGDRFVPGQAWVQFCLIGSSFISESRWVAVR